MGPVLMGVGSILFWIGASIVVNPDSVTRFRFWTVSSDPSANDDTMWRVGGGLLVVLGIATILLGSTSG